MTGGGKAQLAGELANGFFIQPTVFAEVTADMRISREEIFDPVITVLKFESEAEAIDLANNTEFGLGGLVFRADEQRVLEVAEQLDTGSVGLNFFRVKPCRPLWRSPRLRTRYRIWPRRPGRLFVLQVDSPASTVTTKPFSHSARQVHLSLDLATQPNPREMNSMELLHSMGRHFNERIMIAIYETHSAYDSNQVDGRLPWTA
ncbi:aldehyde dehydrogenase family protein [Glutamicibacter ardleyensis]|uniref:aldehyde dehydrogenase family protein n=1 Tax=Glutamicibacter ardleyensis TaxID=225894 RepID=UPI003FD5078C